jgi:hypothetical protein
MRRPYGTFRLVNASPPIDSSEIRRRLHGCRRIRSITLRPADGSFLARYRDVSFPVKQIFETNQPTEAAKQIFGNARRKGHENDMQKGERQFVEDSA